jgi:hypothetical protein
VVRNRRQEGVYLKGIIVESLIIKKTVTKYQCIIRELLMITLNLKVNYFMRVIFLVLLKLDLLSLETA